MWDFSLRDVSLSVWGRILILLHSLGKIALISHKGNKIKLNDFHGTVGIGL